MAFKPFNKLFRPWISSCDQKSANYSVHSLYKCLDISTNQCLPSIANNSDQCLNNLNELDFNSRQCWTQMSGYELMNSQIQFMNVLMRSKIKTPVQYWANHLLTNVTIDGSVHKQRTTEQTKDKQWFTKFKRQRPKRFNCPHCQIAFSNNGQLIGHIRTHTGERPFVCEHSNCGKSFTRNEELTRHRRIHTGIRPYSCTVCSKRFGRKDHLKKHQRTHEKRFYGFATNGLTLDSVPQQTTAHTTYSCATEHNISSFYNLYNCVFSS